MYYQQGNTEMEAHQDGLQTLYLMNPNNNYISYTAADTQSQFMGNIIPQSQQDHDHHHHHHQHSINNIQQHGSLWGLAAADQQQTPKGLSLSLGDDDPSVFQGRLMINDDHEVDVKSSVIMGSKYLKAAHELLDEVVSVVVVDKQAKPTKMMITKEVDDHNNNKNNCGPQLTSAQRQEFLIKKTKLNSMLDEVEQRYKQYQQQMQMMVTSFQQVAGNGSAKTYTQLALKTILKQFRCLKNTISSQLKALCKTLGEEEENDEEYRNSRLKFVDHDHLRQQRTLQQLGMMQNNNNNNNNSAWRPQRGLPEPAVSVLRAWLFEHFLHPYPKDSDKHTLAKQTGLTRSQVSNWFINARVRLWKPMVEDMYLEEIKNQETVPGDDTTKHGPHTSESNSKPSNPRQANNKPEISASTVITKSPTRDYTDYPNNNNPKKPRNENSPRSMLSVDMESDRTIISKGFNDNITLISANPGQNMENYLSSSGFSDGYGISVGGSGFQGNNININSNSNNNNFSLTLALPPSGNYSQGTQLQNFRNFEFGTRIEPVVESNDRVDHGINNRPDGSHPNNGHYEILDFQNRKLPFSSRLIPDHHFLT